MAITLDMLVDNSKDLFPYTYWLAEGYRLIEVSQNSQTYVETWKFKIGEYDARLQWMLGQKYGDLHSLSKSPVKVYCSCDAYYYWVFPYNRKAGCDCSPPALRVYKKKTNKPARNIKGIPSMCKHLLYLTNELFLDRIIQESISNRKSQVFNLQKLNG